MELGVKVILVSLERMDLFAYKINSKKKKDERTRVDLRQSGKNLMYYLSDG